VDLSSEFLPDVLPAGSDLVHLALPIFLEEPADAFIIKGRPAELSCRVAHALSVHFQCNDEVQKQTTTQDHVEPETGIRYTQARVEISLYQVEEFFADYHCACVALSGQGHSKSRLALVMVPFLKREFVTPPYAVQTVEGKQVRRRSAHLCALKILFSAVFIFFL
jgi:netrin receptor unc-5